MGAQVLRNTYYFRFSLCYIYNYSNDVSCAFNGFRGVDTVLLFARAAYYIDRPLLVSS